MSQNDHIYMESESEDQNRQFIVQTPTKTKIQKQKSLNRSQTMTSFTDKGEQQIPFLQSDNFLSQLNEKNIQSQSKHVNKPKQWNLQMEQAMLASVAKGWKWKQIAFLPLFSDNGIDSNAIKRRFESDMRRKFRVLFNKIYICKNKKEKHITDRTYRTLLRKEQIMWLAEEGKISNDQANCLLENNEYFSTPAWSGCCKETRSLASKERLINRLHFGTTISLLVSSIIALQDVTPQNKGFTLKKERQTNKNNKKPIKCSQEKVNKKEQQKSAQICEKLNCQHNQNIIQSLQKYRLLEMENSHFYHRQSLHFDLLAMSNIEEPIHQFELGLQIKNDHI